MPTEEILLKAHTYISIYAGILSKSNFSMISAMAIYDSPGAPMGKPFIIYRVDRFMKMAKGLKEKNPLPKQQPKD